jgi:hypothetical protein
MLIHLVNAMEIGFGHSVFPVCLAGVPEFTLRADARGAEDIGEHGTWTQARQPEGGVLICGTMADVPLRQNFLGAGGREFLISISCAFS